MQDLFTGRTIHASLRSGRIRIEPSPTAVLTKRRKYIEENSAATNITLTPNELAQLEATVPPGVSNSDGYEAAGIAMVSL